MNPSRLNDLLARMPRRAEDSYWQQPTPERLDNPPPRPWWWATTATLVLVYVLGALIA